LSDPSISRSGAGLIGTHELVPSLLFCTITLILIACKSSLDNPIRSKGIRTVTLLTPDFFSSLNFCLIFFLGAPLIANFYDEPLLANLSRLMSLAIFFNSMQVVPNALNLKKLRFKQLGIISVSTHLISGIVAILLAYLGFSYYALIINSILSGLLLFSAYFSALNKIYSLHETLFPELKLITLAPLSTAYRTAL